MQVINSSAPSVAVVVTCGRSFTRVMDFQDRENKDRVHIERRSIQGTFQDCEGVPTVCACVPESGWKLDITQLEKKRVTFFCTSFKLDKSGVCLFTFCGYDVDDSAKK